MHLQLSLKVFIYRIHGHAPPKAMGFELGGAAFENRVNFCCVWAADLSEPLPHYSGARRA